MKNSALPLPPGVRRGKRMRLRSNDRQLAEVLVERDEHSALRMGASKKIPHRRDLPASRRRERHRAPLPRGRFGIYSRRSCRAAVSHGRIHDRRVHAFMRDDPVGVEEAGTNVKRVI
jgi:hypothetical protein